MTSTVGEPLALHTPVQYDRTLIARLLAEHELLNARFATLVCELGREPAAAANAIAGCAGQLQELRRTESLWLYPLVARYIDDDHAARSQLMQLRVQMLASARRIFRYFEELGAAIGEGRDHCPAAEGLSLALAAYLRRNENEIYPLYDLIGSRLAPAAVRAA